MKSILQEASTIAKAVEQGWREAGEPSEFSIKILELPQRNFIGLTVRSAKIAFMFNGVFPKTQETGQKNQTAHPKPYPPREKKEFVSGQQRQPQGSSLHERGSVEKDSFEKKHTQSSDIKGPRPRQGFEGKVDRQESPSVKSTSPVARNFESPKPARELHAHTKVSEEMTSGSFSGDTEARKRPEGLWNEEIALFSRDWLEKVLMHMDRPDITFTVEPQNFYLRITLSRPVFADEGQEKHLLASLSSLMFATIKKHFRKALRGHKIVLTHVKN